MFLPSCHQQRTCYFEDDNGNTDKKSEDIGFDDDKDSE